VTIAATRADALTTYDRNDISQLRPSGNVNGAMRGSEPPRVADVGGAARWISRGPVAAEDVA